MDLAKIRKKARAATGKPQPAQGDEGSETGILENADPKEPASLVEAVPKADPEPEPALLSQDLPDPELRDPEDSSLSEMNSVPSVGVGEKLLVFDLANEKYAIPIHEIAQIIDLPPTTPVPGAPGFLAGIFSLRGRIVSIIDVARRLGLENAAPEAPKVIVVDILQDHFGLLVDRIDQVVDVNLATLEPPPEGFKPMAQDFVEGVFHHRGRAVGFLNLPMFLAFEI